MSELAVALAAPEIRGRAVLLGQVGYDSVACVEAAGGFGFEPAVVTLAPSAMLIAGSLSDRSRHIQASAAPDPHRCGLTEEKRE